MTWIICSSLKQLKVENLWEVLFIFNKVLLKANIYWGNNWQLKTQWQNDNSKTWSQNCFQLYLIDSLRTALGSCKFTYLKLLMYLMESKVIIRFYCIQMLTFLQNTKKIFLKTKQHWSTTGIKRRLKTAHSHWIFFEKQDRSKTELWSNYKFKC